MPVMKKITESEFHASDKKAAIEVYGMTDQGGSECKCVFTAPYSMLKHFSSILEWLMYVPDSLGISFDIIARLLSETMPKRRYYTVHNGTGFIIGIPVERA